MCFDDEIDHSFFVDRPTVADCSHEGSRTESLINLKHPFLVDPSDSFLFHPFDSSSHCSNRVGPVLSSRELVMANTTTFSNGCLQPVDMMNDKEN